MLQDLTRSAIFVAPRIVRGRATKPATPAAPALLKNPDLDECSLDNLADLADLAYRAGDRESAEYFVRRLYALHDRKAKMGATGSRAQRARGQIATEPPPSSNR